MHDCPDCGELCNCAAPEYQDYAGVEYVLREDCEHGCIDGKATKQRHEAMAREARRLT